MSRTIVPEGYRSILTVFQTQNAIGRLKRLFEDNLSMALNLRRASAPLFVDPSTGLNDNLTGVERPVEFEVPETGNPVQIVQSLAKWKRMALSKYGFREGSGLYTDMNAIRRDEEMDNTHSIYVDQWDWEITIKESQRNEVFLKQTVTKIVNAICDASERLRWDYPELAFPIRRDVVFVTAQELEDAYPNLAPEEREEVFVREHKTVFIMKIGGKLRSGERHGNRAPDYDDWDLNGDIIFWDDVLNSALEISSMSIRVNAKALSAQLSEAGRDSWRGLDFHRAVLSGELPLSIGGGIGQSRLCMLLLGKAHIGEVQVSVWDKQTIETCKRAGITLL